MKQENLNGLGVLFITKYSTTEIKTTDDGTDGLNEASSETLQGTVSGPTIAYQNKTPSIILLSRLCQGITFEKRSLKITKTLSRTPFEHISHMEPQIMHHRQYQEGEVYPLAN